MVMHCVIIKGSMPDPNTQTLISSSNAAIVVAHVRADQTSSLIEMCSIGCKELGSLAIAIIIAKSYNRGRPLRQAN